jgi:hypothetical protein
MVADPNKIVPDTDWLFGMLELGIHQQTSQDFVLD